MATQKQIETIFQALHTVHSKELFRAMNEMQAGIGAVLQLLYTSEETVTAGMIAEFMGVSTARVAVLLRKMAAKDLIVKEADPHDARISVVQLSAHGVQTVQAMHEAARAQLGAVIDQVGMERMLEFAALSREIQAAVKNTCVLARMAEPVKEE